MILLYTKEGKDGPLLCCGLLPAEVERVRSGQSVFISLNRRDPQMPDWTLFIGYGLDHWPEGPNPKRHINLVFHDTSLDQLVSECSRLISIATSGLPFNLMLFYAEDENAFMSSLVEAGMTFENFKDERAMVN